MSPYVRGLIEGATLAGSIGGVVVVIVACIFLGSEQRRLRELCRKCPRREK